MAVRGSSRRAPVAIGAALVLVLGVGAVLLARDDDSGSAPRSAPSAADSAPPSTPSAAVTGTSGMDPALLALYRDRAPVEQVPRRGGTVVAAAAGEAAVLDPFAVGGDTPAARDLAPLWLPGLYRIGTDGTRTPWIASGPPKATPDGRRIVIDLRRDARWSDGTPITSADVAATWRRAVSRPGPWQATYAALAGVETPRPTTAVLVLRSPGTTWARLFVAPTGVLPAARVAATGDRPYDLKVTGGPFVAAGRTAGLETVWRRTPQPWPGSDPSLDELRVRVVPDFSTAVELARAGRLDVVLPYDSINAAARLRRAGINPTGEKQRRSVTVLTMRTDSGLLQDVRVRRAIALALDRPAFAEGLVRDSGSGADGLRHEEARGAPYRRFRPDLTAARRLLAEAGWVDRGQRPRTRKGAELTLVLASPGPSDLYDVVARGMQVQLRRIGVQIDLAGADAPKAAELARTGTAHLALTRWDTDVVTDLGRLLGSAGAAPTGAGWPRWRDAAADAAFRAAAAASTLADVDEALDRVDARVADRVPVLPMVRVDAVTGAARGISVVAPVSGYGGPLGDADRWSR